MWNYNTIFSLTKKLGQKKYDFIVNIWVSWIRWNQDVEKVYQVSNVINLYTQKELIVPDFINIAKGITCINSEQVVKEIEYNKAILWLKDEIILENKNLFITDQYLLDMESYSFEFVLEKYNLPRCILKVSIDKNKEDIEKFNYSKALEKLWNYINYERLLDSIKIFLSSLNKQDLNLDKYFSLLLFSFQQKEQFKFLYSKYNVVIWENFYKLFNDFIEKK